MTGRGGAIDQIAVEPETDERVDLPEGGTAGGRGVVRDVLAGLVRDFRDRSCL
jgi:hypothetical protein